MFNDLFVFEKQRDGTEAVGFYLFYLFTALVLVALLGRLFADSFGAVLIATQMLVCLGLSYLVLRKKNKLLSTGPLIIALLSGVGVYLLGSLLGLVATAYLTTLEPAK